MKKSEFEYDFALFLAGTEARAATKDHRRAAERAAYFAEKAGVQWDPEEPELPERIEVYRPVHGSPHFVWPGAQLGGSVTQIEVVPEAAARYNAVGNILAHDEGIIHVDHVGRVLRQERERLQ